MFLSEKGKIQLTAFPWRSIHVLCFFLYLKGIHTLMPLSAFLKVLPFHIISVWMLKLLPTLPYGVICAFD